MSDGEQVAKATVKPEPVARSLSDLAGKKEFVQFAADLTLPGPEGNARRIEVRGSDGLVLVWAAGSPAGAAPATAVGTWQGKAGADVLAALARAAAAAGPDLLKTPEKPEEAVLRVVAGRSSAWGAVLEPARPALAAAFEAAAAGAQPLAALSLSFTLAAKGELLEGQVKLKNLGTEPIVFPHPAPAAKGGALTLVRGEQTLELAMEPGPAELALAGGGELVFPFSAKASAGGGPLHLQWRMGPAEQDRRVAGRRAAGGTLVSAPVSD